MNSTKKQLASHYIDELWEYCCDVNSLTNAVDRTRLDKAELKGLTDIERITSAYALLLVQVRPDPPTVEQFQAIKDLIQSHCSQSYSALRSLIEKQQKGSNKGDARKVEIS